MDVAYDHITEKNLPEDAEEQEQPSSEAEPSQPKATLNTELQDAFKAVSTSPWGSALGGWLSQARKQGETLYQDLQKEATGASEQATKGFSSLREQVISRTRGLTLNAETGDETLPTITTTGTDGEKADETQSEAAPKDIVREAGNLVASLRSTAAARLKDLQRAEDAADEALLRFGLNVRDFLRDAVTITAPDDEDDREVLFETQEPGTGKKVFHSTRLEAQLHAIHSNSGSFTEDPEGKEWKSWGEEFDIERETEAIAHDLDKFVELRRAMEKLVPEKVEYKNFWMRYYFLRKAIEEEERRRREVLKGAGAEEEVGWDDDDDEGDQSATPQPLKKASESTTTLNASGGASDLLKPEPRRSEDENKSVAGSDASYDMVSGATSRATGSPKEKPKEEESDDDWE